VAAGVEPGRDGAEACGGGLFAGRRGSHIADAAESVSMGSGEMPPWNECLQRLPMRKSF
jgi:hypothetical protein